MFVLFLSGIILRKKSRPRAAPVINTVYLFFLLVLALLICNAAACLASGLARSLALTAAALLSALAKILCL